MVSVVAGRHGMASELTETKTVKTTPNVEHRPYGNTYTSLCGYARPAEGLGFYSLNNWLASNS